MKVFVSFIVGFLFGCAFILGMSNAKASELHYSGDTISFTKEGCLLLVPDVRALHEHVLLDQSPNTYQWSVSQLGSDPRLSRFFILAGQISIRNKHMNPVDFSNNFYENCMKGIPFRLLPEA